MLLERGPQVGGIQAGLEHGGDAQGLGAALAEGPDHEGGTPRGRERRDEVAIEPVARAVDERRREAAPRGDVGGDLLGGHAPDELERDERGARPPPDVGEPRHPGVGEPEDDVPRAHRSAAGELSSGTVSVVPSASGAVGR